MSSPGTTFEGVHCWVKIRPLAERVVLIAIGGRDVGEHGEQPMEAVAALLPAAHKVELFIDARDALGPSTDVSAAWAQWLARRRDSFSEINMLTGSRFVQLTAGFVRKFADLNETMRIYTDPTAFETALSLSLARAGQTER
jgi:hypothetical protein